MKYIGAEIRKKTESYYRENNRRSKRIQLFRSSSCIRRPERRKNLKQGKIKPGGNFCH